MAKAPRKCPVCKSRQFKRVDKSKKGFSVGKAVAGTVVFGPLGLVGGGLGKKHVTMSCADCGFTHDYKK